MRLEVSLANYRHKEFVTGSGWVGNDLFTCSDDKTVHRLSQDEGSAQVVAELESFPTDIHFFPSGEHPTASFSCRL